MKFGMNNHNVKQERHSLRQVRVQLGSVIVQIGVLDARTAWNYLISTRVTLIFPGLF